MKERSSPGKKLSNLLLLISVIILAGLIYFKFILPFQEAKGYGFHTKLNTVNGTGLAEHPSPLNFDRGRITVLPVYDPNSDKPLQVDLRSADISGIDVGGKFEDLSYADFDDRTIWPPNLPEGFSPKRILEMGKNPGLGIRQLQAQGITGKSIGLAIIDQPLLEKSSGLKRKRGIIARFRNDQRPVVKGEIGSRFHFSLNNAQDGWKRLA
jgi:hypothetical protein